MPRDFAGACPDDAARPTSCVRSVCLEGYNRPCKYDVCMYVHMYIYIYGYVYLYKYIYIYIHIVAYSKRTRKLDDGSFTSWKGTQVLEGCNPSLMK